MAEESVHNRVSWCSNPYANPEWMLTFSRVALFYLVGLFDLWDGCLTLAISAVGAYLITFIDSPYMPWIGFVFLMGHMSVSHIIRMGYDVTRVDVSGVCFPNFPHELCYANFKSSGAQMVMVMKVLVHCTFV